MLPENSQHFVAMGAALYADNTDSITYSELKSKLKDTKNRIRKSHVLPPLFKDEAEYQAFKDRHSKDNVEYTDIDSYTGKAYLGIDAGSTTTKINPDG